MSPYAVIQECRIGSVIWPAVMQDRIPDPVPSCPSHVIVSSCQCPSRVLHVSSCQCPSHVIVSFRCHRVLHIPVWLLDFTRHYILRVFNMPSCPSHVIVSFTCHRGNQSPCHSHVHQPAKPFQGGGTPPKGRGTIDQPPRLKRAFPRRRIFQ